MSAPGREPPARSGSGSSQSQGQGSMQNTQPSQAMWNNLSMMSSFPSAQPVNGYDRYPQIQVPQMQPTSSSFGNGNGLPMSMFPHSIQGRDGYDEGPRRDSHQAVEMAASALANLGNGSSANPPPASTSRHIATEAGPSQAASRPIEDTGGPDSASGSGSANKKKRKPKQGENLDEDGRRKTARACDQCVSADRYRNLETRFTRRVADDAGDEDSGRKRLGVRSSSHRIRKMRILEECASIVKIPTTSVPCEPQGIYIED